MLTRRDTSKLLAGAVLAGSAGPAAALFHREPAPESWDQRLMRELNAALGGGGVVFSVVDFLHEAGPNTVMRSIVRMDWPPGVRIRPFSAAGRDDDAAFARLLGMAKVEFQSAGAGGAA